MIRMRAPYTNIEHLVAEANVARRLEAGYVLLEEFEPETTSSDVEDVEQPTEPLPGSDATIQEIRAWAKRNGIHLPPRANKATLLKAIGA